MAGKSRPEDEFWEAHATFFVVAVTYPLLLLVGTWGNLLTYHILRRTSQGDRSAGSWLFKCLAIMCLSCLWLALPRHWLRTVYGYDLRKTHYFFCKVHRFSLYTVMDITVWVIVFISFDRLITVYMPSRSTFICTARNAKIGFIALSMFFICFNLHIFWAYGRKSVMRVIPAAAGYVAPEGGPSGYTKWVVESECHQFRDNADLEFYTSTFHPYASFILYVIMPSLFMLISSLLISRKLAANRALINRSSEPEPMIVKRRMILPDATDTNVEAGSGVICQHNGSADPPPPSKSSSRGNLTRAAKKAKVFKDQMEDEASLERTQTRLTLAACIEYVITATPAFCFELAERWLKKTDHFQTPRGSAQFKLMYTTVRLLLFSNFALHFFLFCLTVGRFRKEFKKVLKVWQNIIMIEQRVPQQYDSEEQHEMPMRGRSDTPD